MKKVLLLSIGFMVSAFANAEINGVKSIQGGKGINNGFYIHAGLSFPSMKLKVGNVTGSSQNLGIQPNLEIGNQWYFTKNENFGFGLRVSWLQFGVSSYKSNVTTFTNGIPVTTEERSGSLDLRLLKIAPQVTFGINENTVVDVSFEISPTAIVGGSNKNGFVAAGALFAPGARLRYKKFAVGADVSFGKLAVAYVDEDVQNSLKNSKASMFIPRVYVGFKF